MVSWLGEDEEMEGGLVPIRSAEIRKFSATRARTARAGRARDEDGGVRGGRSRAYHHTGDLTYSSWR